MENEHKKFWQLNSQTELIFLHLLFSRSTNTYTDCFANPAFLKTISLQMKQNNGMNILKLSIIANKGIQTKASFCKQTR